MQELQTQLDIFNYHTEHTMHRINRDYSLKTISSYSINEFGLFLQNYIDHSNDENFIENDIRINFSRCELTDKIAISLLEKLVLVKNSSKKINSIFLDFNHNDLTDKTISFLEKNIHIFPNNLTIDLSNNRLSSDNAQDIYKLIDKILKHSLQKSTHKNKKIPINFKLYLERYLLIKNNNSLEKIYHKLNELLTDKQLHKLMGLQIKFDDKFIRAQEINRIFSDSLIFLSLSRLPYYAFLQGFAQRNIKNSDDSLYDNLLVLSKPPGKKISFSTDTIAVLRADARLTVYCNTGEQITSKSLEIDSHLMLYLNEYNMRLIADIHKYQNLINYITYCCSYTRMTLPDEIIYKILGYLIKDIKMIDQILEVFRNPLEEANKKNATLIENKLSKNNSSDYNFFQPKKNRLSIIEDDNFYSKNNRKI